MVGVLEEAVDTEADMGEVLEAKAVMAEVVTGEVTEDLHLIVPVEVMEEV